MVRRNFALKDVVTPTGSSEGMALWHRVSRFIAEEDGSAEERFDALALDIFQYQFGHNPVYRRWCGHLGWTEERVSATADWMDIPTMPVESFKWETVRTGNLGESMDPLTFRTSGTTGSRQGVHHVHTPGLYRLSACHGFQSIFGPPSDDGAVVFGLLPGYLDRPDSSLVHMVGLLRNAGWCEQNGAPEGGFFLNNVEGLFTAMEEAVAAGRTVVLIGVTWALVDAGRAWSASGRKGVGDAVHIIVTGGMKGRREEWVSERVRATLSEGFGTERIGGEYGMTELLSQAWSLEGGLYGTPHWMRVRIRRTDDPLTGAAKGGTGGVDILDLANLGSCAFLSTRDLGRFVEGDEIPSGSFEILGRFDDAEVRGCNLLIA